MTKQRVFELAKKYGMKGADLAKKLQDLGFEKIRNQMSALDEFEWLQVEARLQIAGIIPESTAPSEAAETKGLTFRRKPRKVVEGATPEVHDEPAPKVESEPRRASASPAKRKTPVSPESEAAAHDAPAPASSSETKVAQSDMTYHEEPTTARPAPAGEVHHKPAHPHKTDSESVRAAEHEAAAEARGHKHDASEAVVEEAKNAAHHTPDVTHAEPAAAETNETGFEEAASAPDLEPQEAGIAKERKDEALETAASHAGADDAPDADASGPVTETAPDRPATPPARINTTVEPRPTRNTGRPAARIVGRIDPALLKPQKPTTPQRTAAQQAGHAQGSGGSTTEGGISVSGSDADVRPTMKHNRSRALTRSDVSQSRDRLSAAQLREKEQQRVRRLTGPQKGGLGTMTQRSGPGGRETTGGHGNAVGGAAGDPRRGGPERRNQIVVTPPVTLRGLSEALGLKVNDLLKTMMLSFQRMGVNANSTLTEEDAKLLALEHGFEIEVKTALTAEDAIQTDKTKFDSEDVGQLEPRAPVIAFLGHVDHGKTSLIDSIRETNVAGGEAGGITQHIGAYRVKTRSGQPITILDTPGHEAFTEMRKRGALATDIVILVVAADDGVMPQTEEAYAHAKAAGVPVIVALNKSDKATEQQKERTIGQLAGIGLAPEMWRTVNWGGHTAIIETSATKRIGIDELLERVALEAEVLDLRANPRRNPGGIVIEAQKSGQRGIVATLLVQKGTLKPGDIILAGAGYGRVRNVYDDRGRPLDSAGPSIPVEVTGLSELPTAGEHFVVVEELSQAAEAAEERARKIRERERAGQAREVSLTSLFSKIKEGQAKEVRIVLKADVGGSLEVLKKQLDSLAAKDPQGNEIHVKVIFAAVGAITEADVNLAAASGGVVIGFHVLASDAVKKLGQREGVEVRVYQILYELADDVKKFMAGLVAPVQREVVVGHCDVRATFRSSKLGTIAGCMVSDGLVNRSSSVRVIRNGGVVYSGRIDSLRRLKDDVREVKAGFECGIRISGFDDVKDGDVLELFEIKEEKPELTPV